MSNKFLSTVSRSLDYLVNRFDLSKPKIISIIALILVGLLSAPFVVSAVAENARISAEFDKQMRAAGAAISSESLEKALTHLEAASAINPRDDLVQSGFREVASIKSSIQTSKTNFKKAKQAEARGKKIEALNLYLSVAKHNFEIDEISRKKATSIKSQLVTYELKKAFQEAKQKKYASAAKIVRKAIDKLPPDKRLNEALARYKDQYSKQQKNLVLSKMRPKYDNFRGITWYRDKSSPTFINQNGFFLYFGVEGGQVSDIHLKMQYYADDWLFIKKSTVNIDGEIFVLSQGSFERDNNSSIWEWQDIEIFADKTNELVLGRDILEKIANSGSAVVRYSGSQYYQDVYISSSQKEAMKNVFKAHDALSN